MTIFLGPASLKVRMGTLSHPALARFVCVSLIVLGDAAAATSAQRKNAPTALPDFA
ncbi:hypothetical protein RBA41_01920 [Massilia sp. CCM 9210]|uniref:hypothetical protein n=1 Tax=Massilia scottii TaxID=3057166 RepID=UPI002796A15E|nr:hypothetical protein [Massilia sp. CCM 9210]MDQ1812050.1 hypothetical protein [Massilia sp. CCM 9210]